MSRCVIVGGADINDYNRIKATLRADDFYIFCDCGLRHREALGVTPSLIVGDFDSFENPREEIETIVLPCEKDDTDTVFAAKEGIRRGFEDFLILGGIGGRFDHSLGNISLLILLSEAGKKATLSDDFSDMEIVTENTAEIPDSYKFFSLLCLCGIARGVSVTGAKYPVDNATITSAYPIGVSNEVAKGQTARVSVQEGSLLLVKVLKE